jgi:hypothetical protein
VSRFVKSSMTSTPVANSRRELERVLLRYGCSGFGSQSDYAEHKAAVWFRVPDHPGKDAQEVPVRLEIDMLAVYDALYGRPTTTRWDEAAGKYIENWNPKGYKDRWLAQAERVAWRHLVLWVDAACSAASAGMQKMSEAFFAHTLVRDKDGAELRLIDHIRLATGAELRRLLPAGSL